MKEGTHKLGGGRDSREALAVASMGDPVTIEGAPGSLRFLDQAGRLLGTLTARHELTRRLAEGGRVLHCSVNSLSLPSASAPEGAVNVRVATGLEGDVYVPWTGPEQSAPRTYGVSLAGVTHFQAAIATSRTGDAVELACQPGNPHDPRAIVVRTTAGATIGYVPRDSFLQRVVHDEGCGAMAKVDAIHPGPPAAVIIAVEIRSDPLPEAPYTPPKT